MLRAFMRDRSLGKKLPAIVIVLLAICIAVLYSLPPRERSRPVNPQDVSDALTAELVEEWTALEDRENRADETVWLGEKLAEHCGIVFDSLWDTLNRVTNKLEVLGLFSFGELVPPKLNSPRKLPHGVELHEPLAPGPAWSIEVWRQFLTARQREGWQLAQVEFRHNRFETNSAGQPKRSTFFICAHLINHVHPERAILEGNLIVDWSAAVAQDGLPSVKQIDGSNLKLKTRRGEPAFRQVHMEQITPLPTSYFIDPVILYDLDGDGLSEIILAARNLVLRRRGQDRFESETLCRHSPGLIFTGIIADFDGDGAADFLCAKFEGLYLIKGSPGGTFDEPGRLVWSVNPHLKYAQVLTCGDIDHDGDLDVWLGQYKAPYERGQMPSPYYDANDGNPSYLLINDGHGNFSDGTKAVDLGPKRLRRSYSGSLVDLDGDGNLDLVVVSDFAGIDLYQNDGRGHLNNVTRKWVDEPHAFGMAHAFADFNADGRLDLLMIGMNSPTADRLNHLGLERPGYTKFGSMRSLMTFGNRLYVARPEDPSLRQTPLNDSIARTGWSWGCSVFDFDNDGFPDVYIANGHTSAQSVREYEPQFWMHDIYVGDSKTSVVANAYFGSKFSRTRSKELSYGGYEKNRLYLNQHAESFIEIGHLMGVALEQDSRNTVADDLDGDGRMDLLVTTFEVWPEVKQTLRIFRNTLDDGGNWIGFRLREQGDGISPVGARLTLKHVNGTMTQQIVAGDSFRSQRANTLHFGLGKVEHVESVEIRWLNGRTVVMQNPTINKYHDVSLPRPVGN